MGPGLTAPQPAPKSLIIGERCPGFLDWLRWQPCCLCTLLDQRQTTSSDPAHFPRTRIHGDVRNAIPLCRAHHDEQHRLGRARFCARYHLHAYGLAWEWWDAWLAYSAHALAF